MKKLLTLLLLFILAEAQPSYSFFVIHCDPDYATNLHFQKLQQMVDTASAYNVPLTMEFSPQWVQMILSDPTKLNKVRQWQQQGHEVAAHHHGIFHCYWDGYTNYPVDSIQLYQPQSPACDSGNFISTMQIFWNQLDTLAGDSLLLTWGSSDNHPAVDLYPNVPYRTSGGRDSAQQGFSNPYTETHQKTLGYGPYTTCQIDYFFIDKYSAVQDMISLYNNTTYSSNYSVVGVVTHVFDFKEALQKPGPNYFYEWIKFISGKGCKNVREILMNAAVCKTISGINNKSSSQISIYPNPSHGKVKIKANLNSFPMYLKIYNIVGELKLEKIMLKNETELNLTTGIYFVSISNSNYSEWIKLVIY